MSVEIDQELFEKAASQISTQDDLADFSRQLLKLAIERVLSAELEEHLGYRKHDSVGNNSGNSRNGHSRKTIKGDFGEVKIKTPNSSVLPRSDLKKDNA